MKPNNEPFPCGSRAAPLEQNEASGLGSMRRQFRIPTEAHCVPCNGFGHSSVMSESGAGHVLSALASGTDVAPLCVTGCEALGGRFPCTSQLDRSGV